MLLKSAEGGGGSEEGKEVRAQLVRMPENDCVHDLGQGSWL